MKEIDGFLNDDEAREAMDSAEQLKRMLECSDKASQIHHPVAKKKVPVPAFAGFCTPFFSAYTRWHVPVAVIEI
jgi:glycerol kinase